MDEKNGGTNEDQAYDIQTDINGLVYLIGDYKSDINFRADWGGSDAKVNRGGRDLFFTKLGPDATYYWTKTVGGAIDDSSINCNFDSEKNIYLTGYFDTNTDFKSDWGGSDVKSSKGIHDAFFTKLTPEGNYLSTTVLGGRGMDVITDMVFLSDGSMVIAGAFGTNVNFAEAWGGVDVKEGGSLSSYDAFVTKISKDGRYEWTKTFGATGFDLVYSLDIDSGDNIYLAGIFASDVNFARDWGQTDIKTYKGGFDAFLMKIKYDGTYGWVKTIGGPQVDYIIKLKAVSGEKTADIYCVGMFSGDVNFAESWNGSDYKTCTPAYADGFLMKITEPIEKAFLDIDYSNSKVKIFPNFLRGGETGKTTIYFGGIENPDQKYRVRVVSVTGNVVKDFGDIEYSVLNSSGLEWDLKKDNGSLAASSLYFIAIGKHYGKFYFKR